MRRVTISSIALLVAALVFAGAAQATQIILQTPQQLGQASPLVVRGKVSTVRSYWNETHTKIFTETVVQVDEAYKGQATSTARVIQMGGVVGNVRMHVYGALAWQTGEEVLLFLEPDGHGAHRVCGFSQGKFLIERDPATGEAFVVGPALDDVEVLGAPSRDGRRVSPRPARTPLDQFVDKALGRRPEGGR
jgi:hypothetical protein